MVYFVVEKKVFYERKSLKYTVSEPIGYFIYHQVKHSKIPHYAHTLNVFCLGSQNKQRLFPCTALTGLFLKQILWLLRGTN
jgi:hypothetical protein